MELFARSGEVKNTYIMLNIIWIIKKKSEIRCSLPHWYAKYPNFVESSFTVILILN